MNEHILIGSDHRGFTLKESLKAVLHALGMQAEDMGAFSAESVDYPEIARKVAQVVSTRESVRGILICGSGIGMSIAANRFPGVRAALCHNVHMARMSRLHNNANVLVLGENVGAEQGRDMLTAWLKTAFEGGRHQNRLDLITKIEQDLYKEYHQK